MKLKIITIIMSLFLLLLCLLVIIYYNGYINNNNYSNTPSPYPISSISITPDELNDTLEFPPNDYAINHINWSSYPNLETGYVYTAYIAGPTSVVPHKFVEVQILAEVKGTENRTIIREQLSGVALEARRIYGINSDINIHGTKHGASAWTVSLLPYNNTVY